MLRIAVLSLKGGVGKTTTAINLADYLARAGNKTLLVDTDLQANSTSALGIDQSDAVYKWLSAPTPQPVTSYATRTNVQGLDIVPSDLSIVLLGRYLDRDAVNPLTPLARALSRDDYYDACVVDCAPSLQKTELMVLHAVDYVLIPTPLQADEVNGAISIYQYIKALNDAGHTKIKNAWMIPTMYDRRSSLTPTEMYKILRDAVGANKITPTVPRSESVVRARTARQTIYQYDPKSPALIGWTGETAAAGYNAVFDFIMRDIKNG